MDFKIDFDSSKMLKKDELAKTRYITPRYEYPLKEKHVCFDNAEKLAKKIFPEEAATHCIISGDFIFGDYIEALITYYDLEIEELTISTLCYSFDNVDSLGVLIAGGYIEKLNLIVSRMFYGHEHDKIIKYTYKKLDCKDIEFNLAICDSHIKVALLRTKLNEKIVIWGSANLRSNLNVEQFTIQINEELFDFYYNHAQLILKRYNTINRAIGYKDLYDLLSNNEIRFYRNFLKKWNLIDKSNIIRKAFIRLVNPESSHDAKKKAINKLKECRFDKKFSIENIVVEKPDAEQCDLF
jgi:hypothetical protein